MGEFSISIIIVSWNARRYLEGCLASIRQHGKPCVREIIVIDNGSSDGSPEMVARDFPEVKLIRSNENLGFARANNLGVMHCSGRFVAFINSDVVVHEGCFEKLAGYLEDNEPVGLVGPKVFWGDGSLQRTCRFFPGFWNLTCQALGLDRMFPGRSFFGGREMRNWDFNNTAEVEVLGGCFWLARRTAMGEVGPLDERFFFYGEDVDWCKRFGARGWKVVLVTEASATHYGGASSSNMPLRYSIEMLRANLVYWAKHYGVLGKLFFFFIAVIHNGLRFALLGLQILVGLPGEANADQKFRE